MNNSTDENQDVAGVYQGFTKNTNEGNNPVYDDATF
jgi:hypothetical protein